MQRSLQLPRGLPSAAHSTVSGEGTLRAVLRQPAPFAICAVDAYGSRCSTGGAPFVLAVRGPSSAQRTLVDAGDGTYLGTWIPTVTGDYSVAITLHGELVGGSPFVVHASVPLPDARRSVVEGAGLHHAVAGELATFQAWFVDANGAPAAAAELELRLETPPSLRTAAPAPPSGLMYCGVASGADGGCATVSYSVRRAGEYSLGVRLRDGGALPGSPFALRVRPAPPHGPACDLWAETGLTDETGALQCAAGERLRLRLRVCDRWGNACEPAEAAALVEVEAGGGRCEVAPAPEAGVLLLSWRAASSGEQRLQVRVAGEHAHGSPLPLWVVAGELSAGRSDVRCSPRRLTAGEAVEVRVGCRDEHGNPISRAEAGRPLLGVSLLDGESGQAVEEAGEEEEGAWEGGECVVVRRVVRAGRWLLHAWCVGEGVILAWARERLSTASPLFGATRTRRGREPSW